MAQDRRRQKRGNWTVVIGALLAVIVVAWVWSGGSVPQTLNQTDDMSVMRAGMVPEGRSPYVPIPNRLWQFNQTGLIRYAEGGVSVAPDNDLIVGLDAGTVTEQSSVTVVAPAYEQTPVGVPQLQQLLPSRDWVVLGAVEAVLYGTLNGPKQVISMKITPLAMPEIIPVPEG